MEYFYPDSFLTYEQWAFLDSQLHKGLSFILPDIVNQMWFLLIIFLFYYFNLVRLRLFIFLLLTAFLPFLINGIVFPTSYMPDQLKYFPGSYRVRNFVSLSPDDFLTSTLFSEDFIYAVGGPTYQLLSSSTIRPNSTIFAFYFFGYFPIPFINSVASLSIINRMLYTVLIILSVHYKIIRGKIVLFFLLFPGLLLYSNIALREMLILTLMLGVSYCLIYKRYLFIIPFLILLFFSKFQNAIILGTICLFYVMFFGNYFGSKFLKIFFLFLGFLLLTYLFFYFQTNIEFVLNYLQELRRYFYAEDCYKIKGYWCWDGYKPFDFTKLHISIVPTILDFAFAPLIWESSNVFHLLQSLSNIFVNLLFILLLYQLFKYNKIRTIFWLVAISFTYLIYGMLIFNFGAIARYRFPFFITFVFIISSEINKFRFRKT